MKEYINYSDFENVDIRVGTVVKAEEFRELKNPSMKLHIDFGQNIGIKKSSAKILKYYKPKEIEGRQIVAVVNFKPKQIGSFMSQVLVLGFPDDDSEPILISPDFKVNNGEKLF
ncbi:MAG: putative chaperone CsaA [Alphaproteobacteria bacterium MarineAlpha5_Bin11]|nr:tRNA-binding protein [Pelagibacteraceae bacterium]PPR42271.1 MAG: putative chaperone CsaA [Alphaproteobacteria bacterium MarineAlpha5_Bin11]PPR50463.1 MAG: putative chaperone CsaA [Alphaproteobacteria bacterium MarineAlpha5_Bin10]|tara:strand:- start:1190 stop:1531 length:342 start_codon:yes stop_codon:yes gene_type:complete